MVVYDNNRNMAIKIISTDINGNKLWVICPKIRYLKYFMEGINPLDFYFSCGIYTINLDKVDYEKRVYIESRIMIDFETKILGVKYAKNLLAEKRDLIKDIYIDDFKQVKDIANQQKYIVLYELYLNTLVSLIELVKFFDEYARLHYFSIIKNSDDLKLLYDLRNLFHHNKSPYLRIENGEIILFCEHFDKNRKYHSFANYKESKCRYNIFINKFVENNKLLNQIEKWAKNQILSIPKGKEIYIMDGYDENKKVIVKKVDAKELIDKHLK